MASPNTDNGFFRVANELAEQFACHDLSKRAYRVLWVVLRHTYGYNRTTFPYSSRGLADATGLHVNHVRDTVHALVASGVLISAEGAIGINKNYDLWTVQKCGSPEPENNQNSCTVSRQRATKTVAREQPKQLPESNQNSCPKATKTVALTPLHSARDDAFQVPKDMKDMKDNKDTPLPPRGNGVPFSQPIEPLKPDEEPELTLTTPALLKPATPAPKPGRSNPVGFDDPRFTEFREAYRTLKSPRRNDGWDQALAIWKRDDLGSDKRFPVVMELLKADLASQQWLKPGDDGTPHGFVPGPVPYLNKKKWRALELEAKVVNPYEHKPWGDLWTQEGWPETPTGVMNFCAVVAPAANPQEAERLFIKGGLDLAASWILERRGAC